MDIWKCHPLWWWWFKEGLHRLTLCHQDNLEDSRMFTGSLFLNWLYLSAIPWIGAKWSSICVESMSSGIHPQHHRNTSKATVSQHTMCVLCSRQCVIWQGYSEPPVRMPTLFCLQKFTCSCDILSVSILIKHRKQTNLDVGNDSFVS